MKIRHILKEKERYELDETYRINKQSLSTKDIATHLQITSNRVVQIRNKANEKLSRKIVKLIRI